MGLFKRKEKGGLEPLKAEERELNVQYQLIDMKLRAVREKIAAVEIRERIEAAKPKSGPGDKTLKAEAGNFTK